MYRLVKIVNALDNETWYRDLIGYRVFVLLVPGDPWLWFGPYLRVHIRDVMELGDVDDEVSAFPCPEMATA